MVFSGGVDSKIVQFRQITNKVNINHVFQFWFVIIPSSHNLVIGLDARESLQFPCSFESLLFDIAKGEEHILLHVTLKLKNLT